MSIVTPASTDITPGNRTAATLVREVLNVFMAIDDDTLEAAAMFGLNAGIALINSRDWKKLYSVQNITLVADDDDYELNNNFKAPIHLALLDSSSNRASYVPYVTLKQFLRNTHNDVTSNPDVYTIDYNQRLLVLGADCSSSFVTTYPTADLYYHKRGARLTQGSSETGLPPEFDEWLVMKGAMWVALSRDPSRVQLLKAEADERWMWLRTSDNAINTGF